MFVCFIAALASGSTTDESVACTDKKCGYLGMGYNIIKGDPLQEPDPGWTHPIFEKEWINNAAAGGGSLHYSQNCNYASEVSSIDGVKSAQANLKKTTSIEASAGGWGANIAFTGSVSVESMTKTLETESQHIEEARATCQLFYAQLPPPGGGTPVFRKDFEAHVRDLPAAKDDDKLTTFMNIYGTHYTTGVTMGGMMVRRWTMKASTFSTLQKDCEKKGLSVEAGFDGVFSASIGASHDKHSEATEEVSKAMSSMSESTFWLGGTPFDNDAKKWADGLQNSYVPVAGTQNVLTPITELLTEANFPGLDARVKETAEQFARRLCTPGGPNLGFDKCTTNPTDPEDLCHCVPSGMKPDKGMIKCTRSDDYDHRYCSPWQKCDTSTPEKTFKYGDWSICFETKSENKQDL